jgi:hypothetical protein
MGMTASRSMGDIHEEDGNSASVSGSIAKTLVSPKNFHPPKEQTDLVEREKNE